MYIIYVWNVRICTKNSISRIAKIHRENVYIICTECLDLQKNLISRNAYIQWKITYNIYVRHVWIGREVECPELHKLNGKLCAKYMRGMSVSAKLLNIQNCENAVRNCIQCMYKMSGFEEKLNDQNCVNGTVNFTHNIYQMSVFVENLNI